MILILMSFIYERTAFQYNVCQKLWEDINFLRTPKISQILLTVQTSKISLFGSLIDAFEGCLTVFRIIRFSDFKKSYGCGDHLNYGFIYSDLENILNRFIKTNRSPLLSVKFWLRYFNVNTHMDGWMDGMGRL